MNAQADIIADILIKNLKQQLSAEEQGILDAWLAGSEENNRLFQRLNDKELVTAELDKLSSLEGNKRAAWKRLCRELELEEQVWAEKAYEPAAPVVHRVHFLKTSWFRYAAAVVLLVGGAVVLRMAQEEKIPDQARNDGAVVQSDVQPGGNKAVLTVGGKKIDLSSNKTGIAVGAAITYTDGSMILRQAQDDGALGGVRQMELKTPRGGQYQAVLPDGSRVWLNAASSIQFPSKFVGDKREIEVTGEVYLEVVKNSRQPFFVHTHKTTVQVLGTSFNINAYQDEEAEKTTLIEGSIRVLPIPLIKGGGGDYPPNQGIILQPGQQAEIQHAKDSKIKVTDDQSESATAWKSGYFKFTNASTQDVMRQLSRWYDVEVIYEGTIPDRRFLGELRRNMTLAAVLRVLERSDVRFRVDGKKIIVKP